MADLQAQIEELWARRAEIEPGDKDARRLVREAVDLLDSGRGPGGRGRSASGRVVVNEWLKLAILLLFRASSQMETTELGPFEYADKIPLKGGLPGGRGPGGAGRVGSLRLVPLRGVVLMPSYVNIGAWVGPNSMVDTWATVGSCAQIGANVHLSGGVGIGGVLEPPNAAPVIVGDDCLDRQPLHRGRGRPSAPGQRARRRRGPDRHRSR
jgi:2,3,4,5-tetrahydropyridine-2,6-dicarboxylate N-succinyltransferase